MALPSSDALANTYIAVQRAAWNVPVGDVQELQAQLRSVAKDARAAWPGVIVDDEMFAHWLADRAPDETNTLEALQEMHTSDLYLACACSLGDPIAVRSFVERVLPAAEPAIARIDPDAEFVSEIRSEVEVHLLVDGEGGPARVRSYIGRGPLSSWVQVVAMRLAYSRKRQKPAAQLVGADKLAALPLLGDDQELAQIRADFAGPFKAAFEDALRSLSPRDRNVLRLHLLEGINTESIGRMYGVHRATVARWIATIHRSITSETRRLLSKELRVAPQDVDSLIQLLRSRLDVSIVSILS